MKLNITNNYPDVIKYLEGVKNGSAPALREALNRTAEWVATDVGREIRKVFDRPVPYTLRSLRVFYAGSRNPEVTLWFKQRSADKDKSWAVTQIGGGQRELKPMELRLRRAGILPNGWFAVPGGAAPLDSYGNMSRGEISRILNVLGTFTEGGYNKANNKTKARLKRGNAKKSVYGFEYIVIKPGSKQTHLQPGIYRRVQTGFGSSLKPMMIFVSHAKYRSRLDFFGIVKKTMEKRFPMEFDKAMQSLIKTGSASGIRRGLA